MLSGQLKTQAVNDFESYIRMLRIKDWLAYFLIAIFGFVVSKGFLFSPTSITIFFTMISLFLAFSFSINNCFDIKEDKLTKSAKNPLAMGKIGLKNALIFSFLLGGLGTILSLTIGFKTFLLYIIIILLSFFYSSPPLRLKSRFLLDLISHGLFFGSLIFLLPLTVFNIKLSLFHYLVAFSIFYFSIMLELRNHIEDYKNDKKVGLKTTVCILGRGNSERLLKSLVLFYPATLLPIFLYHCQYLLPFSIFTLIFYIIFSYKRNYKILDVYANASFGLLLGLMIL